MLPGPIPATDPVLRRAGLTVDDIDLVEVNEVFAPVVLAWLDETGAALRRRRNFQSFLHLDTSRTTTTSTATVEMQERIDAAPAGYFDEIGLPGPSGRCAALGQTGRRPTDSARADRG